ncbi:alpha/beta hydrolase [Leptolyngbya sp. AN02str]|uniref:alpha/beta hydrolase n=1 Tax=Leptolyngbya sp. AN02str TaxID=3423363 RepID=UPI003D31EEE1
MAASFLSRTSVWLARLVVMGAGAVAPLWYQASAWSAETLRFSSGLLEFTLPVESLEQFAETGEPDAKLHFLLQTAGVTEPEQFRALLQRPIPIDLLFINQFGYSQLGETFLTDVGEAIQTGSGQNGMKALRAALTLAAASPEGLSLLNVVQQFPTSELRVDLPELSRLQRSLLEAITYRDSAVATIQMQAETETADISDVDFGQLADLRQAGTTTFEKRVLILSRQSAASEWAGAPVLRQYAVDVYVPNTPQPAPVVVLSHGLGSDRGSLRFLAEHLASYGFVVVAPEHIGSNFAYQNAVDTGQTYQRANPAEFLDRPQDIRFALDELERLSQTSASWRDRLDFSRIGLVGHSYGGYTTLAVAGADLDIARLREVCANRRPFLNFSVLLQCDAVSLPGDRYDLQDERIQAAVALNPAGGWIMSPEDVGEIDIPVMMLTSSDDILTPMMTEQVHPFTWLTTSERYLALIDQGNHATFYPELADPSRVTSLLLMLTKGPDPVLGSEYVKAITLAMMQVHVAGDDRYRPYLSSAYASSISRAPMPLSLVRSLTPAQLEAGFDRQPPQPIVPE